MKLTKQQRDTIVETYLSDPEAAQAMASKFGLAANYAHKTTRELGLLPLPPRPYQRRVEAQ